MRSIFYDDPNFDYQKYWQGREYENQSEKIALRKLLLFIHPKRTLIDIGCGFGRLTPEYAPLFKKCLLVDPSEKLLKNARKLRSKYQNVIFKKGFIEKLPFKEGSFDVAITIRTFHHLNNPQRALEEISRVITRNGYLILEFANKIRFKNILRASFKLDLDYFLNHQPININQKKGAAPFFSYHPNQIKTLLLANGFKVKKIVSVSNFRSNWIKKIIPHKILLYLDSLIFWLNSQFSILSYFGPSVFVLAQKATRKA